MVNGRSQALPKGVKRENLSPEQVTEINASRSPKYAIKPENYCGAKLSEAGIARRKERGIDATTCTSTAGAGTPHPGVGYCKFHGGNTKAGIKHAAKITGQRIIDHEKDLMVTEGPRFGGDRELVQITPEEALLEEVRRSVAMTRWLEERIGNWSLATNKNPYDTDNEGNDLPALLDETSRGAATFTNEREWLILYRQEREHAAKVAAMAIGAGIAERMVHLAEDQGRMLAIAVQAVLSAMNLSPEQVALVPVVVPNILRQVSSGMPLGNPEAEPLPVITGDLSKVKNPGTSNSARPAYLES